MRIAIALDNIYLAETGSSTKKMVLFQADGDVVTAVDEDIISLSDVNYLCLWLLAKRVDRLYCEGLTTGGKEMVERTGIMVYPLEKIREHPILQGLLLP